MWDWFKLIMGVRTYLFVFKGDVLIGEFKLFETPTLISWDIVAADNNEERYQIYLKYIKSKYHVDDVEYHLKKLNRWVEVCIRENLHIEWQVY